jgi:hypothetical protein
MTAGAADQERGELRCNDMIIFIYLTEVQPGDGGLGVLPGSHKAEFMRPPALFGARGRERATDIPHL